MRLAGVALRLLHPAHVVRVRERLLGRRDDGGDLTGVTWVLDHASMMTLADSMPKNAQITLAFDGATGAGQRGVQLLRRGLHGRRRGRER